MTVAYPQSSRNGLAGVIQTRCNAGAGGPRLYLAEAGGALPATGILGFVELADFGAPADGVTLSASNGNIASATASGTIALGIYADSDGNEVHRTDDVGIGAGFEVSLDRLDVIAGDRIKLLADVSYTASLTSPLQVGGLALWHDAESVTGFGTAGFQVEDLTGNGNHGVQTSIGSQPEPIGGVLSFVGSSKHYQFTMPALAGATRAAFVFRLLADADVPGAARRIIRDLAAAAFEFTLQSNGDLRRRFVGESPTVDAPAAAVDFAAETPLAIVFDAGQVTTRLGGAVVDSRATGLAALAAFGGVVDVGGTDNQWKGSISRVFVMVGRVPTLAELQVLEAPRAVGSPLSVAGLKVWHHADFVTGVGTAGYRVADLSGRGNHGTQATTSFQPQVVGGELQFTPADHYDINTANLGLDGATQAVFVWRLRADVAEPVTARKFLADASESAIKFTQNASNGALSFDFPGGSHRFLHNPTFDITTTGIMTLVFDAGNCTLRWNGVVVQAGTAGGLTAIPALATPELTVGGWNFQWDGDISAFLLVTGRIPTEAELQILEAAAAA